jgi:hypothetical protein
MCGKVAWNFLFWKFVTFTQNSFHLTRCLRVLRDAAASQPPLVVARSARGLWLEQKIVLKLNDVENFWFLSCATSFTNYCRISWCAQQNHCAPLHTLRTRRPKDGSPFCPYISRMRATFIIRAVSSDCIDTLKEWKRMVRQRAAR